MKKLLLFFILFSLLLSSIFPTFFISNEIGQKKEEISSLRNEKWELDSNSEREILYYNGEEVERKIIFQDGYEKISKNKSERVFLSDEKNIIRRIEKDGSVTKETNYFYADGLLKAVNISSLGVIDRLDYIHTSDGTLLKVILNGNEIYFPSGAFVYKNDDEIVTYLSSSLSSNYERNDNEEGGYSLSFDDNIDYYDKNGRLIKETTPLYEKDYFYSDDGEVTRTTTNDGEKITEIYYLNGKVDKSVEKTLEGIVIKESRTLSDGAREEIRYVGGERKYRFVFEMDGKRVREASLL